MSYQCRVCLTLGDERSFDQDDICVNCEGTEQE
ncbi:hypothetical protein PBI_BOGOSYJAY_91 [Mycobacterium phage BogosyJay]|nr:hypothetical protein PBI_MAMINIAINA_91 [Mycobacterium phage Maminiaina]QFG15008.1 hypothetical protein PBI_BOGOSYJAY_91 [Mycobacterium phage BogosyJay]